VKKLGGKKISTHAEPNTYLEAEYLPENNRRFARPGPSGGLPPPGAERSQVGQDLPVGERTDDQRRLGGALRQSLFPPESASRHYASAKGQAVVFEGRDRGLTIECRGRGYARGRFRYPRSRNVGRPGR
jgi:hypothetical protein